MDLQINVARPEQAEAIAQLVNAAYRPGNGTGAGTGGWTHESALVSGPRTEVSQVREAMQQPGSAVLVARSGSTILACVQLEREGAICHLGMLAVDPALQGSGLGKTLMSYAERHALDRMECSTIRISVLSRRPELIAFYVRRGFRQTGTVTPYPIAAGVGTPIVDGLSLDTLEKAAVSSSRHSATPDA